MGLKDIGSTLPPGFRFYPSDEELVCHYLYKKIVNEDVLKGTLIEIDLHTCEPWQLPDVAKLNSSEWYFFSFRDRKYATGFRTNRATVSGYWKATGKDRVIVDPNTGEVVGMRKTLVFYRNRAPNGIKTGWIMHEFRLESPHMPPKEDWVLCRVFHKGKGSEINHNDTVDHDHYHHNQLHILETNHNAGSSSPTLVVASPPTKPVAADYSSMPTIYGSHHQQSHAIMLPNSSIPPSSTQQNQSLNNINQSTSLDMALFTAAAPNLFQLLREGNTNNYSFSEMIMSTKNDNYDDHDHGYGLLWDMNLDDHGNNHVNGCLREDGQGNQQDGLEDVLFDDDDNGMVFNI